MGQVFQHRLSTQRVCGHVCLFIRATDWLQILYKTMALTVVKVYIVVFWVDTKDSLQ
jgi:hypothetical protein